MPFSCSIYFSFCRGGEVAVVLFESSLLPFFCIGTILHVVQLSLVPGVVHLGRIVGECHCQVLVGGGASGLCVCPS